MKMHMTIREMAADDKPREKMMAHGAKTMSSAELIAIIIGSGERRVTAVDLARKLLHVYDGDLNRLYQASVSELCNDQALKGIGTAKACKIKAALELGHRLRRRPDHFPVVKNPEDVAAFLNEVIWDARREHFWVLLLDTRHKIFKTEEISVGTLNSSLVHPREVFYPAIRQSASAIILAHNHPSGDVTPSEEDLALTNRLVQVGEIIGIPILDHFIVGGAVSADYFSFKQTGYMT